MLTNSLPVPILFEAAGMARRRSRERPFQMTATLRNGSLYASTARFDGSARALTEVELRQAAPSIFATTAHESRSDRFKPIPTIEVLRGLQREGFSPVAVKQSVSRIPGKADFTKHLIRLRRLDDAAKYSVGDNVFEMMLKNANDGTAAYDLLSGLFRVRCLNSLVAMSQAMESVKVRHSGDDITGRVIDATYTVVKDAQRALAAPADWSAITLNQDHKRAFAAAAHVLRFGDAEGNVENHAIPAARLLETRRADDNGSDLWTTFNVVQENVIQGGLRGIGRNAAGQVRRSTTRKVNGIDQDVKLNKALWTLAEELRKVAA